MEQAPPIGLRQRAAVSHDFSFWSREARKFVRCSRVNFQTFQVFSRAKRKQSSVFLDGFPESCFRSQTNGGGSGFVRVSRGYPPFGFEPENTELINEGGLLRNL